MSVARTAYSRKKISPSTCTLVYISVGGGLRRFSRNLSKDGILYIATCMDTKRLDTVPNYTGFNEVQLIGKPNLL